MEWIKDILVKHVNEEGKIEVDEVMADVNKEFPKQAVPKIKYNEKSEDLKAANLLVTELKADNVDVTELQTKIDGYETEIAKLTEQRLSDKKNHLIEKKLTEVGAKDIDYMMYKLGDVELDDDGNIVDWDNKVKELQENHVGQFTDTTEESNQEDASITDKGYIEVDDNSLKTGKSVDASEQIITQFEKALGL